VATHYLTCLPLWGRWHRVSGDGEGFGWRSHAAKLRCPKGAERASNLLHHRPRSIQNHHRSWRWSPSPVMRSGSQQRWRKCRLTAEGMPRWLCPISIAPRLEPSPPLRAGSQQRWRKCRLTAEGGPPLCLVGQAETVGTAVDEAESSPPSQSAKLTAALSVAYGDSSPKGGAKPSPGGGRWQRRRR
jgi:hypothetical protein